MAAFHGRQVIKKFLSVFMSSMFFASVSFALNAPGPYDTPTGQNGLRITATGATLPTFRTNTGSLPGLNAKTDYTPVGDNIANDGPASAAALAVCDKTHSLYLPPGQYKIRQPL